MNLAISCRNVVAGYHGVVKNVLQDVSLSIGEGQMTALLGPNGAGKSTLLRVLTGLHPHSAGEVLVFGREIRGIKPAERARMIAVVPQEVTTPMAFSVEELVGLGRTVPRNRWVGPGETDRREIERAMACTDTLVLRDRLYTELSGGEKQRVIIAMALAQEPRLLLLDEPTAHLDINHRVEVLELLAQLNRERGLTVLMTSHDLNLAAEFFPQLILMSQGRIAASGTPDETLREDLLAEIYHCPLSVHRSETGVINIAPKRKSHA